jgi:hypothetical protein
MIAVSFVVLGMARGLSWRNGFIAIAIGVAETLGAMLLNCGAKS